MLRFAVSLVLLALVSLLQTANYDLGSINLVLPFIFVLAIFINDWRQRIVLILLSALVLKFYPGFEAANLFFILTAIAGSALIDILPYHPVIALNVAIFLGTIVANVYDFSIDSIFAKLISGMIFGTIVFLIFNVFFKLEKKEI